MTTYTLSVTVNTNEDSADSDIAAIIGEAVIESGFALSVEVSDSSGNNLWQYDLDEDDED
ncbi:MAG: hypothetical protein E6Q97_04485 [Desulfurellales bacterium]|nr:MAG: hypothetical protein E6Q97_04485 [Desulfurellales bacterium]